MIHTTFSSVSLGGFSCLVLVSRLSELLWFPFFVISSSKIISKKGFCFRIGQSCSPRSLWVRSGYLNRVRFVVRCVHSRLSIAVVSIQPTPTQSASSHAMLQRLKKLPLHLVVLLHEGAVVVVVVVVVVVTAGETETTHSQITRGRQRGVKKSG